MIKSVKVPANDHQHYLKWLNSPGLIIPAGKTTVQFYLECHKKGQMKVSDYEKV